MDAISEHNDLDSDADFLTRKQYREMKDRNPGLDDLVTPKSDEEPPLSRTQLREDKETKRQIAERRSKKLAHRLDMLILLFSIGIIIVLLVLFFVN